MWPAQHPYSHTVHRIDGRPGCSRRPERCSGMVQDILWSIPMRRSLSAGDIDPQTAARKSKKIFRRYSFRSPPLHILNSWVVKRTGETASGSAGPRAAGREFFKVWNIPQRGYCQRLPTWTLSRMCSHPEKTSRLYKRVSLRTTRAPHGCSAFLDLRELQSQLVYRSDP